MTNTSGHNKFESCIDCPHRERKMVDGRVWDCHDHCEGYKYRQKKKAELNEKIRNGKREQGITYLNRE